MLDLIFVQKIQAIGYIMNNFDQLKFICDSRKSSLEICFDDIKQGTIRTKLHQNIKFVTTLCLLCVKIDQSYNIRMILDDLKKIHLLLKSIQNKIIKVIFQNGFFFDLIDGPKPCQLILLGSLHGSHFLLRR